jgi:hypothetical protein
VVVANKPQYQVIALPYYIMANVVQNQKFDTEFLCRTSGMQRDLPPRPSTSLFMLRLRKETRYKNMQDTGIQTSDAAVLPNLLASLI